MSRREFEKHLRTHGCGLHRHGAGHDIWINPANRRKAAVPRHNVVKPGIVRSVCKRLEIPRPPGS